MSKEGFLEGFSRDQLFVLTVLVAKGHALTMKGFMLTASELGETKTPTDFEAPLLLLEEWGVVRRTRNLRLSGGFPSSQELWELVR